MSCSPSFAEHALDLLSGVGPVEARRLFGGYGLFLRGAMIGLLDDDELFLKTDAETKARFVEAGCRNWTYGKREETRYYRPPDGAHEDAEAMLPWARLAVEAMGRAESAKAAKAARAASKRRPTAEAPRSPDRRRPPRRAAAATPAARRGTAGSRRPSPRRRSSR